MDSNIEICLEELGARPDDECFIRCVAVSGGQPGLALDREGLVQWMPDDEATCHGLWVSGDGRLMLYGADAPDAVVVERGARTQEAPVGQPVVLVDQDLLRVGDRQLRVHIHGETEAMYEPERLTRSSIRRFFQAATAAASLTLGGAALAAGPAMNPAAGIGEPAPIEVRRRPPKVSPRKRLYCAITKQTVKGGKLRVKATCTSTKKLRVGLYGTLIEKKTSNAVSKGTVKITSIKGNTIHLEATHLKKKSKADRVQFWVSKY
jgi:hypothetical protein